MRRATTICCSAFALLAVAAGTGATLGPLPLVPTRPVWTLALNNPTTVAPAYDATRAFFSLDHDRVVAYEIASGAQLWLIEATPLFQPAAGGDLLFLAEAEAIVARRVADGSTAWRIPMAEPLAVRPVWDNGWLIAATTSGAVLAYRGADGHLVWRRDVGSAAHAAPALAADRLYLPTTDGRIVALNVSDGALIWERRIGGVPNDLLALTERIYVGSTDNFFYCLLARDGKVDWRWRTGADVIGLPVADDRRVYFVSLDNVLRGMNLVSGAQEWMKGLPVRPTSGPVLAGATVVVSGQSPTLRTFSVKDGTPTADINAGDEVASAPRVLTDPASGLTMLLVTTRHLVRGAAATLVMHTIEPLQLPVAPLPNPVMPGPTRATR